MVFIGTFKSKPVAVCVAKKKREALLRNEINVLQQLGSHPHIVSMVYSSTTGSTGDCFLALEAVQPVGFDLDRLIKQYLFAEQSVPSQLIRTLIKQLCGALGHMHDRNILHRDLKSENVLVTENYDAKLIDMHIACKTGFQEARWVYASKTYHPPEMCEGGQPLGHSVDTWGLGFILHQTYQHRWDLIDASGHSVKLLPNRPATLEPMPENIKKAMLGLLAMKPEDRWTIAKCQSEIPPDATSENQHYIQPAASKSVSNRKHLLEYRARSPLTAYAALVGERSKHLHGKKVGQLGFREEHNAILLLMDNPSDVGTSRAVEKVPNKDSVIKNGSWLYFGMPGPKDGEDNTDDIVGLSEAIFASFSKSENLGRSTNYKDGLMAFNLEFDCFQFPPHIGKTAVIGFQEGGAARNLRLRQIFELNLAGIVKKRDPQGPPLWFPGPEAVIEPGDLGLFVRCPLRDGTTEPTVTDEQLQPLMDPSEFARRLAAGDAPRGASDRGGRAPRGARSLGRGKPRGSV